MTWGMQHGDPHRWRTLSPAALADLMGALILKGEEHKASEKKRAPRGSTAPAWAEQFGKGCKG